MRSKKLAFRRDWKAQIMRSACRSSVLKSIHTIHAQGHQGLTSSPLTITSFLPQIPWPFQCFLSRRPLAVIKDGIFTGRCTKMGTIFGGKCNGRRRGGGLVSHSGAPGSKSSKKSRIKNSVERWCQPLCLIIMIITQLNGGSRFSD